MATALGAVDCTSFHLAVVQLLGQRHGLANMSELGVDPVVKQEFAALGLSKKKRYIDVLMSRPDLYERTCSDKGAAQVKLTDSGMAAFESQQIPPMPADVAFALQPKPNTGNVTTVGITLPPMPANVSNPEEARKYFLITVLRCLVAMPELRANTSDLGQYQEIREAWAAGGLNRTYKMIEIIKERPDLLFISTDANRTNATIALTNLGMAYAPGFVVPDPDHSCPPQSTPKKLMYAAGGGKGGLGMGGLGMQNQSTYGYQNSMPVRQTGLVTGGIAPMPIAQTALTNFQSGYGGQGYGKSGGRGYSPY
jgi:hypothetical protein